MADRTTYRGTYDDKFYWERVDRNLGWLGDTPEEQRARQEKLRDSVVGIVGTGGIGGAVALRLVRMGVRNLKLADPDIFELSNVQRQIGADVEHLGRNKAEVVAELAYDLTRDVNIDVFPEGITPESAEEFMDGCDYVMDQMEFYQVKNRYALHRAFRKSDRCKFMLKIPTVGHTVIVYKYTKDSMTIEEVYDIPEDAEFTPDVIKKLVERAIAVMPSYPGREMIDHWFVDMKRMPIFGACPPMAEGILTERLALEILEIPGLEPLPVQPGYAIFDSLSWTAKMVPGKWWTE
ncbi:MULTISPECIES: ThiF family adenylyltransferase [Streptomyces]|uniref:Molybdopterin or thiamine biosynthesis adenylyltransferase n=2 Tax=Streptomyces TaxID=1883 RepID=A0A9X8N671_9ACTN|nr:MULTISPECIES: ThiF family adenylyltransferase [Streptomyces]ANZ20147.1 molybdopterin and thiamine biosynthesis dinucleotide-utilizing enzyme [Streptomyces noursei ATCC 11455]AJC60075.1 molybdopterin and thiamine biosynthesis dinucleotide-utilizing enzyme [Streptomyces sp. 769]MCZ0996738.1 ThiF family adenylyltransferase [Streptomyces noursei]MCZ1014220.1 ThiF family adenylyltransferase [Streptomyces noursei]PNE41132.1 molybdopterin biosynthesis protein MoeB [Streptomyces noursei]